MELWALLEDISCRTEGPAKCDKSEAGIEPIASNKMAPMTLVPLASG